VLGEPAGGPLASRIVDGGELGEIEREERRAAIAL
jgi:hypothetical protein